MLFFLVEIDPEVDFDLRRAVYFRQMRYGLFVSLFHEPILKLSSHAEIPGSYGPFGQRDGLEDAGQ